MMRTGKDRSMVTPPNKRAAVQRRSSLLVRFEHHWPGVPERGRWPEPDFALEMAVFPACR